MASTKDLYDELKGNPIIKINDDYETFSLKLKDANYLKKLESALASIGDDINAYDIPKKKKDGEDESSQPTEQPSATTEPTQADGVNVEPSTGRELGADEAFIKQGFEDRGDHWFNKKTGQIIYKRKKDVNQKPEMPVTDLQAPPEAPEMPETPEFVAPEKPIEEQVLETQAAQTPNTDVNNLDKTTVVGSVISEQEPDANKVNKIVTDANAVAGTTFKRKKQDTAFEVPVITYTPSSASDKAYIYENGKVRSMDKRSEDYSNIIAKNPYTVQLKNSDAFKDLIQLQREGNKQGYQNYLETAGNPAAKEIADRAFGGFTQDEIMEPTIISGDNKDREIPVSSTLIGKLKSSNLYNAAESLWNNIINKEVDRPWQKEEEYDAEDFINNIDPSLSEEEKQAQQQFDASMPQENMAPKGPRQLAFPSYVHTKEDNEIVTEQEQKQEEKKKRASIEFITTNPETGELELGDVNDLTELERYNFYKNGSKVFLQKWEEEKAKEVRSTMENAQALATGKPVKRYESDFLSNPANQAIYNKIKDSKFAPQQGGSELEISLAEISNKQADADYKNLHQNGYNNAYSTEIRTPYDIQLELDNIDKILDAQPKISYEEKMKLYKQKENLNQALLNVYEQNIKDYATYLRNTDHEKAAADMLSTYDYYKKKTGGFQTMPVKELSDADKRAIMNIRSQSVNTTMRYLQTKYQTLSNTVDINSYKKLAKKPLEQVAKEFEVLKSIGALDENGNINPSAKIKQSDQVKFSDAILKINLAKEQIASAAEATGATPENINELTRLGQKLGNLQNTETSFYQKNAMQDLKEEDENDKRNQKIAEDRMKSEDFFTSFFYTMLYGGTNLFIPGLSTIIKIGKVPDILADALGDETQLFDQWSAYIDEMIKDMNAYQPQDMEGLSGTQKFWLNTTAGISNLGAYAVSGLVGGPALTTLLMLSDQTDQAKASGLDDDQAAAWGLFMSMVLGRINQLVPDSKSFYDALKPSTKIILKEWSKGKLTRPEAMGMLSKAIMPSLQKHLNRTAGEFAEESLEDFANQLGGMAANLAWDNASFNKDFDVNSIITSGESGASITAVLIPFQKGGKRSAVEQNVLLSFSQNKNYILRNASFNSQEELNELDKQLTELEAMEVGLQSMPGYTDLSNGKKAEVLSELYRAEAIELGAKNRGLGKKDPGFIEAEKIREDVLNSLKAPKKGEIPTQPELQKPKTNAVQEPSTTEILPSQPSEVRETGRKRKGVEPSVQGETVTEEARKEKVAQQYLDNINQTKEERPNKYWSVSVPEMQDVIDGTLIETEGGQAIVDKTGDIRGLFKYIGSKEENTGDKLVQKAIAAGGIKLDNFALDNLMDIYQRNGFRVVARVEFNEEFAPEGWNKKEHGTPDVVAMIYDPENKLNIEEKKFTKDEYYDALEYQNSFVEAQKQAYKKEVPAGKKLFNEPNPETAQISEEYKNSKGIEYGPGENITKVDTDRAMKIADAYEALQDSPNDPEVKKAYDALINETLDQFKAISDKGYKIELWDGQGEPYASSEEMIKDLKDNKHMYIFSTEQGFGNEPITDKQREQYRFLDDSGFKDVNGKTLLNNDIFRFVHDFFGHSERGNGFGPVGEENAWDVHARMYSPLARRAMTTGTRGQNSWVNFGPQMRNEDGTLKKKGDEGYLEPNQRAFAPPKMGLLPEEFSQVTEVASDTESKAQEERKSIADQVRELKSESGRAYSAALGIPIAIWDGAVELIATSIEAGESFVNAINKAKEYLKQQLGDDYNEDTAEEFMDEVINQSPLQLNNTDKVKGTPVKVNPNGHKLSFVKEEDLIDIDALIKDIEAKGETVWFWVADQLGRGYYMDSKTGEKHYLDAGPSYALDPKNRKKNVIWASGVKEKTLNKNIKKADYIFIISGSPEKSKLFNKAVFQVFQEKIGDYNTFKKEVLANKPVKKIREVLEAHDSWDSLIEDASVNGKKGKIGTGRKKFLNELVDASKKPNSSLYKVLKDRDALVNVDELRDGFYADNNFQQNDIMLVLKPEKLGGKSEHSTYENDLMGEVVGVPNKKINAYDILPDKLRGEDLKTSEQSQKIAPYGSGIKPVSASQNIARGLRDAAKLIRQGKTGGLAVNPIDPFLEVIAKALEAGASLTEAIAKGIEAFKNSDFYKNLTAQEKSKAVNDLKRAMDEQIAPTIANLINEEMLKGKGVYTASQNVKNQMIKEGIIDEATFDRIVGKAEKLVKEDAEMMFSVAIEDAKEAIKAGKTVDEAVAILNDAVNKQIGFYSNLDKSIKKDMVAKAQAKMMSEVAGEIAGLAKSYADTQGIPRSEAIKQAMDETKSSGLDSKVVDNLKDSIESEYDKIKARDRGDSNKNEPVVTTTDKEIMKDKLKAMDAALKEAVEKAKEDENEKRQLVRNWIKDYLKNSGIFAKISPVQMRAIALRAVGLISDMPDSKMKALMDYVQKIVANQEYAKMINDLEKDKKGASKKRHNQYTEAVRRYLSLPLVNTDGTSLMNDKELKAYAESVARLNQSVPDHSLMDMKLAARVLNDYNEIPSKLEKSDYNDAVADIKNSTISNLTEYNEFVKKVNKAKRILDSLYNNGKVTEDDYNDALNDLYTKENGLRVYESDHNDQIDLLKYDLINDILEAKNYVDKSGFIGQQAEVYKRLEVMLTTTPSMIRSLDVKDLVKLTEVMDRMADGFVAEKELREIVNKAETRGQKKGESIVKQLATIYKSLNSPDLTKLRNLLKLTEPAQIERVLGLASGPIYNNIIQPINSAFTKMRKNTERLMDDYYKARQDNKFKGNVVVKRSEYDKGLGPKISDKITVKADKYYSTRVAMLSSIFDYASKAMEQKADTKDFWGENLEKDDVKKAYHNDGSLHIVNDIYSKLNNDPRFQTNGKLDYTKVYEAFLTDPKSVMSEAEYKLYEATQRINKTEIGEALVSANAIRGINGEISAVHYPRKSLGKSSSQDADLVAGTGGKVGGLRAGSSYARVLETPTDAIDLNLDRVMATQIYEASRDLYLNDAIQQTNEVFRNAKENANPDEKAILQAIQDWNRKRVDFELEKSAKNVITRAFGGFASYALIGKVRTPAEFATNLLSGIFNQLSNFAKIGPKALVSPVNPIQAKEALKLMEKFDSPVQFMGWTMKSYAKYGKGKVDKNNLSSFYNNTVNMLMNISGPLTAGEWKADFDAKFKELTGEKYNEAKHLENDEYFYAMQQASSYANQQIERIKGGAFKGQGKQFVAVNPITDIKKLFPGVKIKDEEGMVSSSDTFAQMTNVFNNFVGRDVKNFVTGAWQAGTGRDVSGGIKDMIGSSYRLGSYYLIYNLIDAAMKSALGDDEEKKKGDKKMEMFTTEEGRWDTAFNTVLNFVTTVATSKYGANGRAIAVGCLNYLYNSTDNKEQKQMAADALASMYFQEPVETGQYGAAEKFVYMATTMYIPPADVIANQAQKEFDRLSGSDKYKGATITDFFDQMGKFFDDPEVVEYRKFLAGGLTLASQIGVVTGISLPFIKDVVKLIKKDVQDKQNIVILNKNGENMVEGVLDFDIDGNAMVSVTVDVPGMPADQKKVLNETLSNAASDKFNKLIAKNIETIKAMPEDNIEQEAEKFAWIQYYRDLAVYQAKVEAKLAKPEEAPKEPALSNNFIENQDQKEKMVQKYQEARATGKFSSASKLSTSKEVQEGVQNLIENSPYKDMYNSLNPNNVENIGAIKAMNTYFNDLYKYNVTPVMGAEPKADDYFYKDSNGKITPVE